MAFLSSYTFCLESELQTVLPSYEEVVYAIIHNQGMELDKKNMQRDCMVFISDLKKSVQKAKEEHQEYVKR